VIEFAMTPIGAHRVRFAVSPLDETLTAIQVLLRLRRHPAHMPWLAASAPVARRLPIAELVSVLGDEGYICEFLSPPPTKPDTTAEAQLAEVRRTPARQVANELAMVNADLGAMRSDPERTRDLLGDQLEIAWQELIAPHWSRLTDLLSADIAYRSNRMATGGLALALADLHPSVRLVNGPELDTLTVRSETRSRVWLDRRGLVLVPSVFSWPHVGVIAGPPWQPSIVYPARGVGGLWTDAPTSAVRLAPVVGKTKASLLQALDRPLTTSALARSLNLAKGTVSEHLTALRDAGLLRATRRGRTVLYSRSVLGDALLR
jgi:DNA-binding transcriptional ArsR family regulator